MSQNQDEIELMQRVGRGDARAYRALSDRHLTSILRYATRLLGDASEAEDVTQETFMRLWTSADQWRPEARLSTWLHRIAHNQCIDRLRKRGTAQWAAQPAEADAEALAQLPSDGDRPSDLMARKQVARSVEEALGRLPERQRAAIVLVHYQGLSNPEAAAVLDVGVDAVESLLARGRRSLREMLADLNGQTP